MSARWWTEAAPRPVNPEWREALDRLHAAEFYRQCLLRWGAGPTERQSRWLPTVDRIIDARRARLGGLRP